MRGRKVGGSESQKVAKSESQKGTGFPRFHSTVEIIRAIERGELPEQVMFTFHPQRWSDDPAAWVKELVWQGVKNGVKKGIVKRQR